VHHPREVVGSGRPATAADLEPDGYALFPGALAAGPRSAALDWLSRAERRALDEPGLQAQFEPAAPGEQPVVRKLRRLIWNDPHFWRDVLEGAGVLELGERLVPGRTAIVGHTAFLKPGRVGTRVPLHQDQRLWSAQWPGAVSVWFALAPTTPENGCLEVCAGSHRNGLVEHGWDTSGPHPAPRVNPSATGLAAPRAVPMAAGDALAWHRYLVHGSGPNQSSRARRAMVLVFADADAPGFDADDVLLLRG